MWYLIKGVVLTKDNLAKRNWEGTKKCSFCNCDETIQHLFFGCGYADFIWRLIDFKFNIKRPRNVVHMFGSWLNGIDMHLKNHILAGASAMCWAIWLSRNDIVFDKSPMKSKMQVLYRGTH